MVWAIPTTEAVTLGELNGELYSVTPRDEAHLGDEFVRRGGRVFPPARVTGLKARRPFGQQASLTEQQQEAEDDVGARPRAIELALQGLRWARVFFIEDEQRVVRGVLDGATRMAQAAFIRPVGDDHEDSTAFVPPHVNRMHQQESIAAIAWHPTLTVLAVAQRDGVVALYDVATSSWDSRVLEHSSQQEITALGWARCAGGIVAVAARGGLFVWKLAIKDPNLDPELLGVWTHPTKTGLHQLSWSEDGSFIATFAEGTNSVFIIDVVRNRMTELQSPAQVTGVHWSPSGDYFFTTTKSRVSVIWETCTWRKEIWDVATGCCGWSNNGRCLLLSPQNTSLIYPYEFKSFPPSMDVGMNAPAIDFTEKDINSFDQTVSEVVGGIIQAMSWDPTGARVAVTFAPSVSSGDMGPLVAIVSVVWKPFMIFTKSGLIRGPPNAGVPRSVAFASSFQEGALLSIAWSSGLISFHPFYFAESLT